MSNVDILYFLAYVLLILETIFLVVVTNSIGKQNLLITKKYVKFSIREFINNISRRLTMNDRISDLHVQLDIAERKIEELEQQLTIKDSIIRRQGVLVARLQEQLEELKK